MGLRRPNACPICDSIEFVQILYGRPTDEAWEIVDRGEAILGSCFVFPGQPDWHCKICGHEWFDPEDPIRIKRDKFLSDLEDL